MHYFFGIFSLFLLFFLSYTTYSLFKLIQSLSKSPQKYYNSEEMLPLKLINKKVHSIFPNDVASQLEANKTYVWLTSSCSSCNKEFETLNSDKDLSSNFVGFLTDSQEDYPFRNVKSNIKMLPVNKSLSTEEMGNLFFISPIYFSLDSQKKIKKISASHHPFKNFERR